ncbi:hypothetical protein Cgig2_032898 [Carnegiea gigantea]|uniref:Uncharacterized protein n=1 Tax=Carnegiea gigantea TaxID=171969 RepID=A0A9Q1JXE7_9CARY|nr:hypothetical protein Cgig2_032898 [Carnegiea gigantea]
MFNPIRIVRLPLQFRDKVKSKSLKVDFLVVYVPTVPTLHRVKVVIAPYLLRIQYESNAGTVESLVFLIPLVLLEFLWLIIFRILVHRLFVIKDDLIRTLAGSSHSLLVLNIPHSGFKIPTPSFEMPGASSWRLKAIPCLKNHCLWPLVLNHETRVNNASSTSKMTIPRKSTWSVDKGNAKAYESTLNECPTKIVATIARGYAEGISYAI